MNAERGEQVLLQLRFNFKIVWDPWSQQQVVLINGVDTRKN